MLALPLRLIGCNIYDADDRWIALVRGEMAEYRAWGAEIVAAVNSHAELLAAARLAFAALNDLDRTCYGQSQAEIDAVVALRAAIAKEEQA